MRILGLISVGLAGLSLSACSQISNIFKNKSYYPSQPGPVVRTGNIDSLRTTPAQPYRFENQSARYASRPEYVYASRPEYVYANRPQSNFGYSGRDAVLYNSQTPAPSVDPRNTEFIKLNGESKIEDWRNCENLNRGYLWISEYDFRLHPEFEVCMRNKGYVLAMEFGPSSKPTLSAQSARLRSGFTSTSSYSQY